MSITHFKRYTGLTEGERVKGMKVAGSKVKWVSQSGGYWREKEGTLLGYAQANVDAMQWVPKDTPVSRVKFQAKSEFERAIVLVPRGGKSKLSDYYAPRPSMLEEVLPQAIESSENTQAPAGGRIGGSYE